MSAKSTGPQRCPTCDSPSPELHPAMQHEGEVQPCSDPWHATVTHPSYYAPVSPAPAVPLTTDWLVHRCRICRFSVREDDPWLDAWKRGVHRNAHGKPDDNKGTLYCPFCEDETLVGQKPPIAAIPAAPAVPREGPTLDEAIKALEKIYAEPVDCSVVSMCIDALKALRQSSAGSASQTPAPGPRLFTLNETVRVKLTELGSKIDYDARRELYKG